MLRFLSWVARFCPGYIDLLAISSPPTLHGLVDEAVENSNKAIL